MTIKSTGFAKGVILRPDSGAPTEAGEIKLDSADNKLKVYADSASREVLTGDQTQTVTNKTIDADSNTISNIDDGNIKAGAAIDAAKIANGSVSSTEFQYLGGVTGDIQTQLNDKASATALSDHLSDASDAHDASAISVVASGNLVATDAQAALVEHQDEIDDLVTLSGVASGSNDLGTFTGATIPDNSDNKEALQALETAHEAHVADASGAHAASAISNTPSGNLAATDVQAALNELQSDVDSRATSSDLTTHTSASTGVHGITGAVVGTTDAQVLANKDIDGGTASNTSRLTVPKATKATLDGLTRKEATLVFASDEKTAYIDDGTNLIPVGSGSGGSLDVFYKEDFSVNSVSTFSSGNNATFLGGGSIAGTLANETVAPISGNRSIKFTQAGGSLNDYFALAAITPDLKEQGNTVGVKFAYTYDGAEGDIAFVAYDVTNARVLSSVLDVVKATSSVSFFATSFTIPSNCTSLRIGFQVKALNSGKIFSFDDVELSTNPFFFSDIINVTDWTSFTPTGSWVANTTYTGKYRRVGDSIDLEYLVELTGAPTSTNLTVNLPTLGGSPLEIDTSKITYTSGNGTNLRGFASVRDEGINNYPAGTVNYNSSTSLGVNYVTATGGGAPSGQAPITQSVPITFGTGDKVIIKVEGLPILNWVSANKNVVTPQTGDNSYVRVNAVGASAAMGSTNTTVRSFPTTADTSGSAITYTRSTTLGDTFTINVSGLYNINYQDSNNSGAGYMAITKNGTQLSTDPNSFTANSDILAFGETGTNGHMNCSNEVYLNVGDVLRAQCRNSGARTDASYRTAFSITKIGYKSLSAVPVQQIAYLKDIKANNTAGGTFTSGSYQTRTLNTIEGDSTFVTLSSNQFTLGPGKYKITAFAPCYRVSDNKIRIYNTTDASVQILGQNVTGETSADGSMLAMLSGEISIVATKTFELQHRCTSTLATIGFGPALNFGENEVYSIVEITKLR